MIRSDDVESAIAVHIAHRHGGWISAQGERLLGRKSSSNGTTTRAQDHAGVFGSMIRSDDIEPAIAVHIAQCHRLWIGTCGEGLLVLEGAIAIA